MTSSEAILRLRALLNQYGITDGYYTDPVLYKYLDSAQLEVISGVKAKQEFIKKVDKTYESPVLNSLLKSEESLIGLGASEITLPSDFLYHHSLLLNKGGKAAYTIGTEIPYEKLLRNQGNYFQKSSVDHIKYSVIARKIILPIVAGSSDGYRINYYKIPETVSSSVNFSIYDESHNAIIQFALSFALQQDQRTQESLAVRSAAINLIFDL